VNPLLLLPVGELVDIFLGLVMTLFVISGILLIFVVLIQEGKGGGIAGAFGGAGQEAFGVKAGTVNRFTAYVGTAFLLLALLHAGINAKRESGVSMASGSAITEEPTAPPTAAPIPPTGDKPAGDTPPGGAPPPGPAPAPAPVPAPGPSPVPAPGPAPVPAPGPAPVPEPAPVPPAMER
jgi:protein translocase SecG subunit